MTRASLAIGAAALSPARAAGVLWRFSRPHTLLGTLLSIMGIAAITGTGGVADLLATLLAGAAVNVFIVGLNQLEDVEIDRVNKPHLPIPAGDLTVRAARRLVAGCAVLSLGMAVTQGAVETVAVLAALAIGVAYSSPPLRLKRHPAVAAGCISLVRAVVVNLGVCLHFTDGVPDAVWALTLFVLPFSFAIAVLKDVPDAEGDRRFAIATFTVRLGPRRVLRMGLVALTVGYGGMALLGPLLVEGAQPVLMAAGHLGGLGAVWWWAARLDPGDPVAFTAFYMRIWTLFFLEYVLVPVAVVL